MSDKLFEKIVTLRPPAVYVSLDKDAIQDSIVIADKLLNEQISTYIINLDDKDPSDLGFERMLDAYNSSQKLDESILFNLKMKHNVK